MEEKLSELEKRVEALTRRSRRLMWGMGAALAVAVVAILAALWPVREFETVRARLIQVVRPDGALVAHVAVTPEGGGTLGLWNGANQSVISLNADVRSQEENNKSGVPVIALAHPNGAAGASLLLRTDGGGGLVLQNVDSKARMSVSVEGAEPQALLYAKAGDNSALFGAFATDNQDNQLSATMGLYSAENAEFEISVNEVEGVAADWRLFDEKMHVMVTPTSGPRVTSESPHPRREFQLPFR